MGGTPHPHPPLKGRSEHKHGPAHKQLRKRNTHTELFKKALPANPKFSNAKEKKPCEINQVLHL